MYIKLLLINMFINKDIEILLSIYCHRNSQTRVICKDQKFDFIY